MEYSKFVVPSDAEMLETLGVSAEPGEDPAIRTFQLTSETGDSVQFSYDVPGRSFRVQVSSGGTVRLDLLRESATHLSVSIENGTFRVRVLVKSSQLAGELSVSVGSEIVVRDELLMI